MQSHRHRSKSAPHKIAAKTLHLSAIPLHFIAEGELCRSAHKAGKEGRGY